MKYIAIHDGHSDSIDSDVAHLLAQNHVVARGQPRRPQCRYKNKHLT